MSRFFRCVFHKFLISLSVLPGSCEAIVAHLKILASELIGQKVYNAGSNNSLCNSSSLSMIYSSRSSSSRSVKMSHEKTDFAKA